MRGVEESCISASPKEMVDLTALLSRHHSQNSHSSQDDDDCRSPTSEEECMSVDSPYFRPRRHYTSESEGSVTEVGHLNERIRNSCLFSISDLQCGLATELYGLFL